MRRAFSSSSLPHQTPRSQPLLPWNAFLFWVVLRVLERGTREKIISQSGNTFDEDVLSERVCIRRCFVEFHLESCIDPPNVSEFPQPHA